jgi:hypothetical protein
MNYSEEQIQEFKRKADLWDALDDKIYKCFFDENGEPLPDDEEDAPADLTTIGEYAATAFGYF